MASTTRHEVGLGVPAEERPYLSTYLDKKTNKLYAQNEFPGGKKWEESNGGVKEAIFNISKEQLLEMNTEGGTEPLKGIQLLPAPGQGKAYIVEANGIEVSYKGGGKDGYKAKPYGGLRLLEVYYPTDGYAGDSITEKIVSIPFLSDPYTEQSNLCNLVPGDLVYQYTNKESLRADLDFDSLVVQPLSVASAEVGYSRVAIENQPIYASINDKIEAVNEGTVGSITIKIKYNIADVTNEVTVKPPIKTVLSEMKNKYLEDKQTGWLRYNEIDFGDIKGRIPSYAVLDNSAFDPDHDSQWRMNDSIRVGSEREYQIYKGYKVNGAILQVGINYLDRLHTSKQPPVTDYYNYGYVKVPFVNEYNKQALGFPFNEGYIDARNVEEAPYDESLVQDVGCFFYSTNLDSSEARYYNLLKSRISEVTISNPGSGYVIGDQFIITGGDTVFAEVIKIGGIGEILEVRIIPDSFGFSGGQKFTNGATPSVSDNSLTGVGGIVEAIATPGNWVENYSGGIDYNFSDSEDFNTTARALRDSYLNGEIQFIRSMGPFMWSNLYLIEFQIKKYKS